MQNTELPTLNWKSTESQRIEIIPEKLSELDSIIKSKCNNINGIIVVKKGDIVFENYYRGYGPNDIHHVASVTKSILSALIGIAIKKEYIKSIDQKVLDFFPEYISDTDNENKQKVTIRHLLTMTAPYPYDDWNEPLDKLCTSHDWVKYTLDMLGQGGNIGGFKYSTAGSHLLSAIITRSTGKSALEFANKYLFGPIGMRIIPQYKMESFSYDDLFGKNVRGWVTDPHGNSTGGWGLTLTPRDMVRFGLLYLNYGFWNNQEIIPKSWIEESTASNKNNYGYLWWLFKENTVFAYAAMGDGGNTICCIPSKNMVVSIVSEFMINPYDRWKLIKEHILPIF
ncbi:serine hydrolase domain-containing protein [Maledivibacter halophilus]|uniref:CubicO group peptidase, beta-lactamase class C family n=1 Tax=Maledivibacter halophilus TaxID=36842 RepID=A0A1T5JT20_9FIRM|nr:serine hydrolase [Maledivibacter halophilus]SKC54495.1 CubicO group peptidase, beta-lactamase class C family [Maledivibacter halophilus]